MPCRIIEMNIGIICACMPACAAAFRGPFRFPNTIRSWFSKGGSDSSSKGPIVKESKRLPTNSNKGSFPPRESYIELEEAEAQHNGNSDSHIPYGHAWARAGSA